MADDRIEIEITLDDGSIQKGFAKLEGLGKKAGSSLDKNLGGAFGRLGPLAAAAGTALAAAFSVRAIKNSISAAIEQENAINRLNTSLATAGRFSQAASDSFQNLANEIQRTTLIGDEEALSLLALSNNFAKTNEQAQLLTKAAIELSAATGKGLTESLEVLGRSLGGQAGRLTQLIPQVKDFTASQLKAGAALDLVISRFGGTATSQVNTFGGALTQAGNAFGDISEGIGDFFVKSPTLINLIKEIGKQFGELSRRISGIASGNDIFQPILQNINAFAGGIAIALTAVTESVANFIIGVFSGLQSAVLSIVSAIIGPLALLAKAVSPDSGISKSLNETLNSIQKKALETKEIATQAFGSIFGEYGGLQTAEAVGLAFVSIGDKIEEFGEKSEVAFNNFKASSASIANETLPTLSTAFKAFSDSVVPDFDKISEASRKLGQEDIKKLNETVQKDFKAIGESARTTFGSAIGQGFAAFGKALVKGENALKAFTDAFLQSIAQGAVALGTEFILRGIAYAFVPGLQGLSGPLIAAGAALATFGGALGAVTGGGASSASGGGGSSSSPTAGNGDTQSLQAPDIEQKQTNVKIDVGGTVLDPIGVGRQIAAILSDTFEATGTKVVTS